MLLNTIQQERKQKRCLCTKEKTQLTKTSNNRASNQLKETVDKCMQKLKHNRERIC